MYLPRSLLLVAAAVTYFTSGPFVLGAEPELLANPGFESNLDGWTASKEDTAQGMSKAVPDAARSGKFGLHVTQHADEHKAGSSLLNEFIAATANEEYQVSFWARCNAESGIGVFLQYFDEKKHLLSVPPKQFYVAIPASAKDWTEFNFSGIAPEGTAWVSVWVHGWSNASCNADFDDFSLKKVNAKAAGSPRVSAEQIKTVAAMLETAPRGVGEPITNRAAWERIAKEPGLRTAAVARAERLLNEPDSVVTDEQYLEFTKKGRAAAYQTGVDQRRLKLVALSQAECLENMGRFLPAIEKEIATICAERTWVGPPHDLKLTNFNGTAVDVDLISAMTVWNLATTDFLLGSRLRAETRQIIRSEAQRRVFKTFLAEARGELPQEWWSISPFNWNPVVHSGIVGAALALIDDRATRAEIVAYAVQNVKIYLTGFKPDGYTGEGLGYWNYGFGHYTLLAETLLAATHSGINLYADERACVIAQMPRKLEVLPNIYPAFSDCLVTDRPDLWMLNILDHRYGFGWQIAPTNRSITPQFSTSLYALAINHFFDPSAPVAFAGKADAQSGYHQRDWLPNGQVFIARPPTKEQAGLGLALKGGTNNEPHGHMDLGTYVVAHAGESVLLDPGAPIYIKETFGKRGTDLPLRNSHDHAVPIVAGQLQQAGAEHRATIAATNFTDALDTVTLDLTKGYEVPTLKRLTRKFDYKRSNDGEVTITDDAIFQTPQSLGTALVTLGQFRQLQPGLFLVSRRHSTVQVSIDTGGVPFTTKNEPIVAELKSVRGQARRLGIELTNPAAASRIVLKITPASSENPDPSQVSPAALESLQPGYAQAITVKAAEFIRQSGGSALPATGIGASGGAVRSWKIAGQTLTWKFRVTDAGTYGLQMRHCSDRDEDTECTLTVDSTSDKPNKGTRFFLPPTGGWSNSSNDWITTWAAADGKPSMLKLLPGDHEITVANRSGESVLDWVKLVPFLAPTLG